MEPQPEGFVSWARRHGFRTSLEHAATAPTCMALLRAAGPVDGIASSLDVDIAWSLIRSGYRQSVDVAWYVCTLRQHRALVSGDAALAITNDDAAWHDVLQIERCQRYWPGTESIEFDELFSIASRDLTDHDVIRILGPDVLDALRTRTIDAIYGDADGVAIAAAFAADPSEYRPRGKRLAYEGPAPCGELDVFLEDAAALLRELTGGRS